MQINLNHIERNINRNKTRSEIIMQKVINSPCHIYPNKIAASINITVKIILLFLVLNIF